LTKNYTIRSTNNYTQ